MTGLEKELILAGVSSTINWFIERCGPKLISLIIRRVEDGYVKAYWGKK
jgi:hypothetical protein